MKKFNKLFIILLCCIGAMSVTSCLNSDDGYTEIDHDLYKATLTSMNGSYYGQNSDWRYQNKIYYYYNDEKNNIKTDSIVGTVVSINALDTAFTVSNVTGKVFAKQIPDSHKDLREALENYSSPLSIKGKFDFTRIITNAYYSIYNTSTTIDNLEYNGEKHKVTIAFWGGYPYSSGAYGKIESYNMIELYLCLGAIFVDDNEKSLYDFPVGSESDLRKATLFVRATR